MADYHILAADTNGNSFNVVMHFPVADTVNQANVNYRTAIVEWQGGAPIQSVLANIGAEQTQLDAGELYEHSIRFNSNPTENLAQKQARLDALWESERAQKQAELLDILSFWGYERIIP